MIWRKRFSVKVAMLLTWAARSSSPACALISVAVATLSLSLDNVAVLEEDGCKQGMSEAQAIAHAGWVFAVTSFGASEGDPESLHCKPACRKYWMSINERLIV